MGLALMENNMRSRIITTTRIIGVAEHVGGCYRLKPLSDESSEILFNGRIFGSKDKCPRQFSQVSKKIMKKCGGVPLAIVTTSSLLANKSEDIRLWNDVCSSIGSGLGRHPAMDDMRKILLLSYYDLPSHLKTCLLYLCIFPEDYKIQKYPLIRRWVAEGFVQQAAGDQSFHEIGETYFNELLNRSLIQPANMDDVDGTPHACHRMG
jgi:disease resistance protein RPM1